MWAQKETTDAAVTLVEKISVDMCWVKGTKWAKAGPEWVGSTSLGPMWAIVGFLTYSDAPQQCFEGVLAPSPNSTKPSMFCLHWGLKQQSSISQHSPHQTELPPPTLVHRVLRENSQRAKRHHYGSFLCQKELNLSFTAFTATGWTCCSCGACF